MILRPLQPADAFYHFNTPRWSLPAGRHETFGRRAGARPKHLSLIIPSVP